MYIMVFLYLGVVCHVRGHDVRFLLTGINDGTYTSDIYLTMTSLEEGVADVIIHMPRKPDVYLMKTIVLYGQWTNVTLPPHIRLKDYDKRDYGRYNDINAVVLIINNCWR